jgi:uncharacterized protein (UPF0333 family)
MYKKLNDLLALIGGIAILVVLLHLFVVIWGIGVQMGKDHRFGVQARENQYTCILAYHSYDSDTWNKIVNVCGKNAGKIFVDTVSVDAVAPVVELGAGHFEK